MELAGAGRAVEPGVEAGSRHIQHVAQPADGPDQWRCLAMKTNLISPRARKKRSPLRLNRWRAWLTCLQNITLRTQPCDLFLQGCNLGQIGTHLPVPGECCGQGVVSSRIQRRSTLSATSRSRAVCGTATPRSITSLTASTLNSRLNFCLVRSALQFLGHNLSFVSTKPAVAQQPSE